MSYLTQAQLTEDGSMWRRVTACAASEGIMNPETWAHEHSWELSAQPGWVGAYASAQVAHEADPDNVPPPGANEAAITDGMILSAVQSLLNQEA